MTKENDDALRCAYALRMLDSAKKNHPSGPGGQMMGCESYRLVASGFSFYELQNSADHLQRLVQRDESATALVQQMLEALERMDGWLKVRHMGGLMPEERALTTAAREWLEGKA